MFHPSLQTAAPNTDHRIDLFSPSSYLSYLPLCSPFLMNHSFFLHRPDFPNFYLAGHIFPFPCLQLPAMGILLSTALFAYIINDTRHRFFIFISFIFICFVFLFLLLIFFLFLFTSIFSFFRRLLEKIKETNVLSCYAATEFLIMH